MTNELSPFRDGSDHWVDYGKPEGYICTCPVGEDHPRPVPTRDNWLLTDCITCDQERQQRAKEQGDTVGALKRRMIVCSICGDKRCMRAFDHNMKCDAELQ